MAENIDLSREGLCTTGGKVSAKELVRRDSGHRNPETRAASQKIRKLPMHYTRRGGPHAVAIWGNPHLERFQGHPYGKYRLIATDKLIGISARRWSPFAVFAVGEMNLS